MKKNCWNGRKQSNFLSHSNSIESFKTISTIVFEKCYLQKKAMIWKDTITYFIILGTILVYSVINHRKVNKP